MAEAAQALRENILALFEQYLETDQALARLLARIHDGNDVGYHDALDYAMRVGGALREAFRAVQGDIPEHIDTAFADTLLREALRRDHTQTADAAAAVQQALNKQAGLGLKAVAAPLNTDRIDGLVGRLAGAERTQDVLWLLGEPLINFSQSIVDDTLRANVEFQGRAGLRPRVVRTMHGKGCRWCQSLAGAYDYPDVPNDVYRRHERCRCVVTYDPGMGKRVQDVWSKRWTSAAERDKIKTRKRIGEEDFLTVLAKQPSRLVTYTPESLKRAIEQQGYKVTSLTKGRLKGVPFEDGGGYKVNFTDSGLLMYHPKRYSHHGGAYYKISTGRRGLHHYGINGQEFDPGKDEAAP